MLGQLNHPNLTKIYEYYENENHFFVIHELCEGGPLLGSLLKESSLTEEQVAFVMKQLLHAVRTLHQKEFIIGNLNPMQI